MAVGYQLVQDVAVLGVELDGDEVLVDVYGGPEHVCASVAFTFDDATERAANVARLRRWEQAGTALALVAAGTEVRLLSERALFDAALEAVAAD